MTVKELIKQLESTPQEHDVFVCVDDQEWAEPSLISVYMNEHDVVIEGQL